MSKYNDNNIYGVKTYKKLKKIEGTIRQHWGEISETGTKDIQTPMELFLDEIKEIIKKIRTDVDSFQCNRHLWKEGTFMIKSDTLEGDNWADDF